jgi:hypothetical protein
LIYSRELPQELEKKIHLWKMDLIGLIDFVGYKANAQWVILVATKFVASPQKSA